MRISKGFMIICVLALVGYGWYQHQKVDVDVSESGFVDVGEVAGVDSHFITVVGPTWNSELGQRTKQFASEIKGAGMAVVISSSIGGETIMDPDASQLKKLRALNDVMKGEPPVVFIKGTAKANPTLDEVIAEYNRNKQ